MGFVSASLPWAAHPMLKATINAPLVLKGLQGEGWEGPGDLMKG